MADGTGWQPDPYGRYLQRYHDGERWTAHVVGPDGQTVDPLGTSPVIPFVTPATRGARAPGRRPIRPAVAAATCDATATAPA